MATATYIGDQREDMNCEDHKSIMFRGIQFPLNKGVQVDDPAIIQKLEGNPHFHVGETKESIRDALIREAEELGMEYDARWGWAKIKARLDTFKREKKDEQDQGSVEESGSSETGNNVSDGDTVE